MMAVGDSGTVYVTRPDSNDAIALRDADGDGKAEAMQKVAGQLQHVHGIARIADCKCEFMWSRGDLSC